MLFKDSKRVKDYAEFSGELNFNSIKITLRMVEQQHVVPLIGSELYNALNTAYGLITDENNLSSANQLLLDQCRCVIGPYLCYYYTPKGEIKLSDAGARREETGNVKTAFQYQITNFREQNLREGEMASEMLLAFLEDNKSSYPEWVNSAAFVEYRSLFIKSGKEFQALFPSHSPYRNYMAVRAKMLEVEQNNIRRAIGKDLYDALKVKDTAATPTFTSQEKDLLFMIKKAAAYLSVSFSIPYLNVRIDENGLSVVGLGNASSRDADTTRDVPSPNSISNVITTSQSSGQDWLANAVTYLEDNAVLFPLYVSKRKPVCNQDDSIIEVRNGRGRHRHNHDHNSAFGLT